MFPAKKIKDIIKNEATKLDMKFGFTSSAIITINNYLTFILLELFSDINKQSGQIKITDQNIGQLIQSSHITSILYVLLNSNQIMPNEMDKWLSPIKKILIKSNTQVSISPDTYVNFTNFVKGIIVQFSHIAFNTLIAMKKKRVTELSAYYIFRSLIPNNYDKKLKSLINDKTYKLQFSSTTETPKKKPASGGKSRKPPINKTRTKMKNKTRTKMKNKSRKK